MSAMILYFLLLVRSWSFAASASIQKADWFIFTRVLRHWRQMISRVRRAISALFRSAAWDVSTIGSRRLFPKRENQ